MKIFKYRCKQCGKIFFNKVKNRTFCSRKCHNINQKGKHHSPKTEFKKGTKGKTAGHWKNGRTMNKGYVMIYCPEHPYARMKIYVPEQRLVMEKHLGRYITPDERVHHINGIKTDNRIENLVLFNSCSEHQKYHQNSLRILN